MSGPDRDEVRRLFLEAASRRPNERAPFLDRSCGNGAELRREVESLLEHHRDATVLVRADDPRPAAPRSPRGLIACLAVALALIGGAVHLGVDRGLRALLEAQLETAADVNVAAIESFLDHQRTDVARISDVAELHRAVARLFESHADDLATARAVRAALTPWLLPEHIGYAVVDDETGTVLAAADDTLRGETLSTDGMRWLSSLGDDPAVVTPFRRGTLLSGGVASNDPVMCVMSRVGDAVLAIGLDPSEGFSRVVSLSRPGRSGEAYVFDRHGTFLTESRFDQTAVLTRKVVTPDGAPTRMAAAAVAGRDGVDVKGYADYRGVEVIGAWRWLPAHDLGVAVEIDRREAVRPLRALHFGAWALFGLLAVATVWLLRSRVTIAALTRRVRSAERLGQYTLEEMIGEGGIGTVWRARHAFLKRPTAVKILKPERVSDDATRRFEHEADAICRLTHPSTIALYDFGRTPDARFYAAMEYVDGPTLEQLIAAEGRVPPGRVVHILEQVLGSLAEAHGAGLIHRDIKPQNIMLCRRGGRADVVKVLDFGLVKDVSDPNVDATARSRMAGTPLYIAPERLLDSTRNDAGVDLYSVGAVAFKLLTGENTFAGTDPGELLARVLESNPRRPNEVDGVDVPTGLDELVLALLSRDPDARPSSCDDVLSRIAAIEGLSPWTVDDAAEWWATTRP